MCPSENKNTATLAYNTHIAVVLAGQWQRHPLRAVRSNGAEVGRRLLLRGPLRAEVARSAGRGGLGQARRLAVVTSRAYGALGQRCQTGIVGVGAWFTSRRYVSEMLSALCISIAIFSFFCFF